MPKLHNHVHVEEKYVVKENSVIMTNSATSVVTDIYTQCYPHVCALERNVIKENSVTMENAITRKWKLVIILSFEHTLVFRTRVEAHVLAEGNLLFFQAFNI